MSRKMWQTPTAEDASSTRDELAEKGKKVVLAALKKEGFALNPMSMSVSKTMSCTLPDLVWSNLDVLPQNVKIINSSSTVVVKPIWQKDAPFISGGCLTGQFVLSEFNFRWGATDDEGSDHLVEGKRYPLEMHAVHYNNKYSSCEAAHNKEDGIAILVYFFEMNEEINGKFSPIMEELKMIETAYSIYDLLEPLSMANFLLKFTTNYFMYWGSVTIESDGPEENGSDSFLIPWLICRTSIPIASSQLMQLRTLKDEQGKLLLSNHGNTHDTERTLFHISNGILIRPMVSPIENQSLKGKEVVTYKDPTEETGEPEEME